MDPEGPYQCSLDQIFQEKATKEINENPKERQGAIDALRQWIKEQPHINFPTDTDALVMFLRGAKWSQLRAREMVEGNLYMKIKVPEWFTNIDPLEPGLLKVLERGYCVPLPKRDKNGSQLILYRTGVIDSSTKAMSVSDELRAGMVLGSLISQSEITQVAGSVFIFDFTGMTSKHMTRWSLDDMRKWSKVWQKNMPGRFKAFHYYNAGKFFEGLMAIVKPFLNKKYQDRIQVHPTADHLYKQVDMELLPVEYLPDDYKGPHQGNIDEIVRNFVNTVTTAEYRQRLVEGTSSKYFIDESKRPKLEPQASFRKLTLE